jgi:hypothetical protein
MLSNAATGTRRNLWTLTGALLVVASCLSTESKRVAADSLKDGRIAIIHVNESTIINSREEKRKPPLLQQLRDAGVEIIGRYLGRCREGWKGDYRWTEQIVHGGTGKKKEEVDAILDAGFGLISIYQYLNTAEDGKKEETGRWKLTHGLGKEKGSDCEVTPASKRMKKLGLESKSAKDEGQLDSQAAVRQARHIGQPKGTPIYFAIDYEFESKEAKDEEQVKGLLDYFREVKEELSRNGYLVGAYGDGDALALLNNEKLIKFAWISPSAAYSRTSEFFNLGHWNLAHAKSDNGICLTNSGDCFHIEYDADIQNKSVQYVGAWNRSGRYLITFNRARTIFDQRRFICDIKGVRIAPKTGIAPKIGKGALAPCSSDICFAEFVRIQPTDLGGQDSQKVCEPGEVLIDFNDYGGFDSCSPANSLTRSLSEKPIWCNDPDRLKQNCTCFGSKSWKPCEDVRKSCKDRDEDAAMPTIPGSR